MFDYEVLHPGVIDVLEEPRPVDDTGTNVRHVTLRRSILHVDKRDTPGPPVEERHGVTTPVNDPV